MGKSNLGRVRTSIGQKAGPIIEHAQLKYVSLSPADNFNLTALDPLRDSVLDGSTLVSAEFADPEMGPDALHSHAKPSPARFFVCECSL
jgi:hypothetical protein